MTIEQAAKSLSELLHKNFQRGTFSIGVGKDEIFLYEHVRGKWRLKVGETHEGFKVTRKYVGKIVPAITATSSGSAPPTEGDSK